MHVAWYKTYDGYELRKVALETSECKTRKKSSEKFHIKKQQQQKPIYMELQRVSIVRMKWCIEFQGKILLEIGTLQ